MIRLLFLLLALIHAIPALAAVAPASLTRLYGVPATDSALLQHRAVLFGLLAASRGELSGSLRSIVVADVAGLLIALFAAILLLRS